ALLSAATPILAAPEPVFRISSGANNAAISAAINQFFTDLGGANNGVGGSYTNGRRDLNWDSVSDDNSEPNTFSGDYYRSIVPKGAMLSSMCAGSNLTVSADSINPTSTPVRFGNIDPSYPGIFTTFNSQKLLASKSPSTGFATCSAFRLSFFVPETNIPATVKGIGVVFADVDSGTEIRVFDVSGRRITPAFGAQAFNSGLSFIGVTFATGERIAAVEIWPSPYTALAPGGLDGNAPAADRVAVAAIFYGEPRASQFHSGDADGDGVADARVFRPATGEWFTLNSGSNTVSIAGFGAPGDIPIDGDFDGDSRADLAVFRPSEGGWYIARSSNGTFLTQTFGAGTDKPVAGDYDKDGKTDIAVWRPSSGQYYVLRSSDNQSTFFAFPFGQNGDIPVQGAAQ
ncbi:MAG TPA: VCBS repeat-containing protein, partial [Pyrinomonadaceae bacterium]|nr:VCBS repeat-containing protein [Pyrinomonadaceae bacterium]